MCIIGRPVPYMRKCHRYWISRNASIFKVLKHLVLVSIPHLPVLSHGIIQCLLCVSHSYHQRGEDSHADRLLSSKCETFSKIPS